jgi:ribonuclease P protein component
MLKKKYRLTKRKHFNYVYRKGRTFHGDIVTLVFSFARLKNVKVGFSASKKVGNSVVRHRALRLMREAAKPLLERLTPNNNYIFVAKEGITAKHLTDIRKTMENVLRKAGVMRPE